MPLNQTKPNEENYNREAQLASRNLQGKSSAEPARIRYLRVALAAVGVTFIVGIYSLVMIWPSGWAWHSGQSHHLPHYLQMILGVYATLGVFLLIEPQSPPTLESDLVHRVVQRCACRNHGGTGFGKPGADRTPLG